MIETGPCPLRWCAHYKNDNTEPPLALVKLLKVLDRHPDLLDEIKVADTRAVNPVIL